jgi:SAM-dependent methyltransferase
MCQCVEEAARILRPGGKLVLVESCVPRWFYAFEKVVYKTAARFIEALLSHPVTLQYPIEVVEEAMHRVFTKVRTEHIPKGKFVLQFGIKVPSALTPVDPYIIVGEKALDAT